MKRSKQKLELLQHSRHDWLNKLQIIKGNLELSNVDHARKIIDDIIIEARQEAHLTSFGVPGFAEWLLTYNWYRTGPLKIGYEFMDQMNIPEHFDSVLLSWAESCAASLEQAAPDSVDHELYFIFQKEEDGCFSITVEFDGGELQQPPSSLVPKPDRAEVEWISDSRTSFTVQVKFSDENPEIESKK